MFTMYSVNEPSLGGGSGRVGARVRVSGTLGA